MINKNDNLEKLKRRVYEIRDDTQVTRQEQVESSKSREGK